MDLFPELPKEIREKLNKLCTAAICDVMDLHGFWNQTMVHTIKPLDKNMRMFGRALTILAVEVYKVPEKPYKLEIESVDSIKKGDVLVVTQNGCESASFWGELLSTSSMYKGAEGIVIDGFTRDAKGILDLKFPCFVNGLTPADSKGRMDVIDNNIPINCGGVIVNPGDYIFGDIDGVCVIPKDYVVEILADALAKIEKERNVRKDLEDGKTVGEVFEKYGIL